MDSPTSASTPPSTISSTRTPPPSAASSLPDLRRPVGRHAEHHATGLALVHQARDDCLENGAAADLVDGHAASSASAASRPRGTGSPAACERGLQLLLAGGSGSTGDERPAGRWSASRDAQRRATSGAGRPPPGRRGPGSVAGDPGGAHRCVGGGSQVVGAGADREHGQAAALGDPGQGGDDVVDVLPGQHAEAGEHQRRRRGRRRSTPGCGRTGRRRPSPRRSRRPGWRSTRRPGRSASRLAVVWLLSEASSRRCASTASAARMPEPPEVVTTATRCGAGRPASLSRCTSGMISPRSSSSSTSSTRTMPSWRSAASTTAVAGGQRAGVRGGGARAGGRPAGLEQRHRRPPGQPPHADAGRRPATRHSRAVPGTPAHRRWPASPRRRSRRPRCRC